MIKGNKGEWSEFYVLLSLLAQGKLFAADASANRIDDIYFPILNIERCEVKEKEVKYYVGEKSGRISVSLNGVNIGEIEQSELGEEAKALYNKIVEGGDRAFAIPDTEGIMGDLLCDRLAAPSTDKSDIRMQLHDVQTGYSPICGFSIKSELGSAPTLLNASKATNFVYQVIGLSEEDGYRVNSISTKNKIIDRIEAIYDVGSLEYVAVDNNTFSINLQLIDSRMDELIAAALIVYYKDQINDCLTIVERLEEENPLNFPKEGFYKYKFKKFLSAVALGMTPATLWDGYEDASGGYIIVNKIGDVVAYHIYNRNAFEDYLLNNTRFERASTSRHDYASIYVDGDEMFIRLNLQVRFK